MTEKCLDCKAEYDQVVRFNRAAKKSNPKFEATHLPLVGELRINAHGVTCTVCTHYECQYRHCKHSAQDHINGSCYAITEPDKVGVEQFCKCDSQHGANLRLYQDLIKFGLNMTGAPEDMMVTKPCEGCNQPFLLRRHITHCLTCIERLGIKTEKLREVPDYHIRQPVTQEELQTLI